MALVEVELENYVEALEYMDEIAGELEPDEEVAVAAGRAFVALSRYQESVSMFQVAVKLNPEGAVNYVYLGRSLYWLGKKQEAIQFLTKGLEMDDSIALGHLFIGYATFDLGEHEIAKAALNKAIHYGDASIKKAANGQLEELAPTKEVATTTRMVSQNTNAQSIKSQSVVPKKYVDNWYAQFSSADGVVKMRLTLGKDSRYHMHITTGTGSDADTVIDEGSFEVKGGKIVRKSDSEDEVESHAVKWERGQMVMHVPGGGYWVRFTRLR